MREHSISYSYLFYKKYIKLYYTKNFERFGQIIYTHHQQINIILTEFLGFIKGSYEAVEGAYCGHVEIIDDEATVRIERRAECFIQPRRAVTCYEQRVS